MHDGLGGDADVGNPDVELDEEKNTLQSQLTECSCKLSTVCVKNLQRKIELKPQRADISASRKHDLA